MGKTQKISVFMTKQEQFYGFCYLAFQSLLLPSLLRAVLTILYPDWNDAALNLLYFAVNFAASLFLFWHFLKGSLDFFTGNAWPCIWKAAVALVVCKAAGAGLNALLQLSWPGYFVDTLLGPALRNPNDMQIAQMVSKMPVLFTVATVLLVPATEELLHRGLIFGSLYRKSRAAAYAVSIFLFSAIHVIGYLHLADPVLLSLCFAQYLIPSLCLCFLYGNTGSVFAPILMHMAYNAVGILFVR